MSIYDNNSNNSSSSPTIYLESYYEAYCEGVPLGDIADDIIGFYNMHNEDIQDLSFDEIFDFEKVKDKIVFKVVNQNLNEKIKKDSPFITFKDLMVIFQIVVFMKEEESGFIRISNEMMKGWNIPMETLVELAMKNTEELYPASLITMTSAIGKVAKDMGWSEDINLPMDNETDKDFLMEQDTNHKINDILILTNSSGMNGFSCIMYQNCAKRISGIVGGDFYILPSSLHEAIIVPLRFGIRTPKDLLDMVRDVNKTVVNKADYLSDNLYYYDHVKNEITTIENVKEVVLNV